jgi:hypothetical protein
VVATFAHDLCVALTEASAEKDLGQLQASEAGSVSESLHPIANCTAPTTQAIAVRISDFTKCNQIMRNHCGLHLAH